LKLSQVRRHKRRLARRNDSATLTLTSLIDIFTLLVCFLLVGFQGEAQIPSIKGLALPISNSYIAPESALAMAVTPEEIRINEKKIQSLALTSSPASPSATDGLDLGPLAGVLQQEAKRFKPTQVVNGSPQRMVIILADKNIPYAILRQIMIVCSQQGFGRISFAVNKEAKENA
jgi:biopolymer transport protein TolR